MKPTSSTRRLGGLSLLLFAVWLCMLSLPALAQVQARVDRNPIDMGETVTLSLEMAQMATPDLSPLQADFEVLGRASSQSMQMGSGGNRVTSVYEVTLAPKRAGNLQIPPLQMGNQRSPAIALTVRPAPPMGSRDGNADVFLETTVDASAPYVQQSVGVVLRLYYAIPLLSGELQLDPPANALMQKVGDDVQSSRQINGRSYTVVERRFLLVPERSGEMTLPGPRFRGRAAVGWFDNMMGNRREVSTMGPPRTLQVRAQPAGAAQPWLPLRDLRLRYVGAPDSARTGEAAMVTIEGIADGATRAQLPDLPAPTVDGAQVFPEPMQYDETFVDGRPQVKWTQRYAVVPDRTGELVIGGASVSWWDVAAGTAKTERLGDLRLRVGQGTALPGAVGAATPTTSRARLGTPGNVAFDTASATWPRSPWVWLTVGFAALWLITLLWALRRRPSPTAAHPLSDDSSVGAAAATATLADLRRALDSGSLDDVAEAVRQLHAPPLRDLDAVIALLARADQRAALEALRRARWADGDGPSARAALRKAFADGPQWQPGPPVEQAPLPPLYPSA